VSANAAGARPRMAGLAWERVAATGVTYRQFDHWTRRGYITAPAKRMSKHERGADLGTSNAGSGFWRFIDDEELKVLAVMVDLVALGVAPSEASKIARTLVDSGSLIQGSTQIALVQS